MGKVRRSKKDLILWAERFQDLTNKLVKRSSQYNSLKQKAALCTAYQIKRASEHHKNIPPVICPAAPCCAMSERQFLLASAEVDLVGQLQNSHPINYQHLWRKKRFKSFQKTEILMS